MKKSPVILIGILLIIVVCILELPNIFENKPKVTFTGIENVTFLYTVTNNRNYDCSIQTQKNVVNCSRVILDCKNKIFPVVVSKKSVVVSGLYKLEVLSFDKLQIQLMGIDMDLKNPKYVYFLENPVNKDPNKSGVSLYLFYVDGDKSSYYMVENLFVKDEHYDQADFESGVLMASNKALKFDVTKNVVTKDLPALFSVIKNLGFKELNLTN